MLLEKPHKHLSAFAGQNTADIAAAVLQMVEDMRNLRLQIALSGWPATITGGILAGGTAL